MSDYDRIGLIRRAGERIAGVAAVAPDATVRRYRDRTVIDVVRHTGLVHRRTTKVVRERLTERPRSQRPPEEGVVEWFTDGLAEMVDTLESADPSLSCWGFGPDPTVAFWTRRMALETEVHRWDIESATGEPTPPDPEVAADGIDEIRIMWLPWVKPEEAVSPGPITTFAPVDAKDTWTLIGNDDGYELVLGTLADAIVSGPSADIYLALLGRDHGHLTETAPSSWREVAAMMGEARV